MSQPQFRDLVDYGQEFGTTDDPRKYDHYDPLAEVPDHLTHKPDFAIGEHVETDADAGLFACTDCHRRITRNSSNFKEYGHDTSCEHHEFARITEGKR